MTKPMRWGKRLAVLRLAKIAQAVVVLGLFCSAAAQASTVALLIGSSTYTNDPLEPANRAVSELAETLSGLGVSVHHLSDPTRVSFPRALEAFTSEAAEADVALVVYVGHGLRLGGRAFIVPTDVTLRSRSDLKHLVPLQPLLDAASRANSHVVILDACHESSLAAGWGDQQYQREPLCASASPGFDLTRGAGLVWVARTPSNANNRSAVGRLAMQLARSSALKDLDLGAALSAIANSEVVSSGVPASMVMPISPVQSGGEDIGFSEKSADVRSAANTVQLEPGLYGISDFRGSRWISQPGASSLSLIKVPDFIWQLDRADDNAFAIINRFNDLPLRLSGRSAESSTWQLIQAVDGQENEYQLQSTTTGRWLVSRGGRLAMDDDAGSTGWLFNKATAEQRRTRIALVEAGAAVPGSQLSGSTTSSASGQSQEPAGSTQGSDASSESQVADQPRAMPSANAAKSSTISDSARDSVVASFRQVSEALESNDVTELQKLLPSGDARDYLLFLAAAYRNIDAELTDFQDSGDSRIISTSVTIVSVDEPLPGISGLRLKAPVVTMHRERADASSENWSAIRFGSGG